MTLVVDNFLTRLEHVRQVGDGRWIARCPSHEDMRPSLAIRGLDDGRVLVHCYAGCPVRSVLDAVGLTFDALYPTKARRVDDPAKPQRRPFPATDVLRCVGFEALVVAVAAARLANGGALDDSDRARLLVAASRIHAAVKESGHE